MKKFFRLVSVFAIAGVTFAYTSCTDYSEDIEVANGRITTLEGSVASLQSQVSSLQSSVSSLQTALTTAQNNITALQSALATLETKHDKDIKDLETAYKAADAALKTALEKQISDLQKKHNDDVAALTSEINALKTLTTTLSNRIKTLEDFKAAAEALLPTLATKAEVAQLEAKVDAFIKKVNEEILPTLATKAELALLQKQVDDFEVWAKANFATKTELSEAKAWVVATFATKEALGEALKAIGALEGRMDLVEATLKKLDEEILPDIYEKITAAHTAANLAQADATKALGDIATLREALGVYAEKGKLEETIAGLVKTDSTLNAEILKLIAQDEAFKIDIENLQKKDAYFDLVIDTLKKQDALFDIAIKALQEKDKALDKVDQKHDSLITVLQETKLNIADFQKYFDESITEAIKDEGKVGKAIIAKVEAAKTFLLGKITELRNEVMGEIAKINGIFPERLTSIVFVPQYYVGGIDAILFETLAFEGLADNENATPKEFDAINKYKYIVAAETTAKYRFSPKTVGLDCADFDFVGNIAETRVVAPEAPIQIVGKPEYDAETGEVVFTVEKKENVKFQEGNNKVDIVALKATLKKGLTDAEKAAEEKPVVFSEYEMVKEVGLFAKDLAISDSIKLATGSKKWPAVSSKKWAANATHEYTKTFNDAVEGDVVYEMPYDKDFNLGELVATCFNKDGKHSQLDLAKFGLYYKFSVATSKYEITTAQTTTNQQTNIECLDGVKGIYRATGKLADGTDTPYTKESIGRKPIVKIELMHGDQVVTRAFVKLEIVVEHQTDVFVNGGSEGYVYGSDGCGIYHTMKVPVETMRSQVYRVLNISHEEFWNTYEKETSVVKVGKNTVSVTPPTIVDGTTSAGVATKEILWKFNDSEVGKIGNGLTLVATITLVNKLASSSPYPEHVTFQFDFTYTLPDYTSKAFVDVEPKEIFWKDGILQANVNRPETTTDVAANCWFNTRIEKQPWDKFVIDPDKELCIVSTEFVIEKVILNGVKKAYDDTNKGVYISEYNGEVSIALKKGDDEVEVALNSLNGLQALVAYKATLQSGDVVTLYSFLVNFIRPLNLNMPEGLSVIDAKTGGDVIDFNFAGLLTDWRGELVLPPYDHEVEYTDEWYYWKKVCSPADHSVTVIPGYQRIKTPASWDIQFAPVTITVQAGETKTVWTATIPYEYGPAIESWYAQYGNVDHIWKSNLDITETIYIRGGDKPTLQYITWNIWGQPVYHDYEWERINRPTACDTYEVSAQGRSKEEARQNAMALVNQIGAYFGPATPVASVDGCAFIYDDGVMRVNYTSEEINVPTTITFQNMVSAVYTPAVYEDVEPEIIISPCNEMPGPDPYEEIHVGDRVGCWQYVKASETWTVTETVPGQYWDFYGPIAKDVVLDLEKDAKGNYKNVTTDLPDHKLPAGASLVQVGNTLKYENVLSPIQHSYHIYIPAKVTYGWGAVNSTLTVLVKPVATIGGGE